MNIILQAFLIAAIPVTALSSALYFGIKRLDALTVRSNSNTTPEYQLAA
jgi:hypothetical protein